MNKTMHTTGPWKWWDENTEECPRPKKYDLFRLLGDDGSVVINGYGGGGEKALGSSLTSVANASLIAAAPATAAERDRLKEINTELLAALIDARSQLEAYAEAEDEDFNSPSINAAIAKATAK